MPRHTAAAYESQVRDGLLHPHTRGFGDAVGMVAERAPENVATRLLATRVPRHPYLTLDNDLTAHERRALAAVPPISGQATTLLAGLVSRYNLVDRRGHWATSLSWDPLERPGVERRKEPEVIRHGPVRRLWGAGDSWELRWTGYPEPRDLALALTHREAGVKGAEFTRHGDTYRVVLGTASLDLCDGKG